MPVCLWRGADVSTRDRLREDGGVEQGAECFPVSNYLGKVAACIAAIATPVASESCDTLRLSPRLRRACAAKLFAQSSGRR